jgi:hypothetical protein
MVKLRIGFINPKFTQLFRPTIVNNETYLFFTASIPAI